VINLYLLDCAKNRKKPMMKWCVAARDTIMARILAEKTESSLCAKFVDSQVYDLLARHRYKSIILT